MLKETPFLVLCGTRPEAIKLAPVVRALRAEGKNVQLVLSGQHPELALSMLHEVGMEADASLGAHQEGGRPEQLLSLLVERIGNWLAERPPALVIVQGDTLTAFAGALAASYAQIPVAHIEAGLRTGDLQEPFPEEMHRLLIAGIANLHFAPTARAAEALLAEGVAPQSIHVTGNTGVDSLRQTLQDLAEDSLLESRLLCQYPFITNPRAPLVLATVHRRENIGTRLQSIATALARLAGFLEAEIILPLHPNPMVRAQLLARLQGLKGCHLIEPVSHKTMIWLLKNSELLLTDSGGLQEEAPTVGVRTLVLRQATERMEAVEQGIAHLVPLDADSIVAETRRALQLVKIAPSYPYGDGYAAERIARILTGRFMPVADQLSEERGHTLLPQDFA